MVRDETSSRDLYDVLAHSVRESQYSTPSPTVSRIMSRFLYLLLFRNLYIPRSFFLQWPHPLRLTTPTLNDMPAMILERYRACQTVAFCGLFPEIRRAWASVDNSLFLWRYDTWNDVPIEYCEEEQAIVSVGLCTPRPGVFVEAIRYLLVICTASEIVLLGVCCNDETDTLMLQQLPMYSVPSDNVSMTSVKCTSNGRIFLGGGDGNLYEVVYTASDSWRGKRCRKVCHTGGLRQLLPYFVSNAFFFGGGTSASLAALVDLVVDEYRNILYARSQGSMIQVYDLGGEGKDAPARVAEVSDFLSEASKASGGREVFGRGSGDKQGASVTFMAPILPHQSRRLQLMTVTADGRRVYWSCYSSPATTRPDRLRPEIARGLVISRPLSDLSSRFTLSSGRRPLSLSLHVASACTGPEGGAGTLLLAADAHASGVTDQNQNQDKDRSGNDATRLVMVTRDMTLPPVGTAIGVHVEVVGLRESVEDAGTLLPGEPCAVAPISYKDHPVYIASTHNYHRQSVNDNLTSQNAAPRPKFVVLTTAGTVQVERLRPADILIRLLLRGQRKDLENFFSLYAPQESAAMCIQIASGDLGGVEGQPLDPTAVARAEAALDEFFTAFNVSSRETSKDHYTTETEIQVQNQNLNTNMTLQSSAGGQRERFDMGAVVQAAEPGWSAAHEGLCLYVSRVLGPTWDRPVLATMSPKHRGLLRCTMDVEELVALEQRLSGLASFLVRFLERRGRRPPASAMGVQWWDIDAGGQSQSQSQGQIEISQTDIPPGYADQVSKRQRLADEKIAAHAKELDHLRLIAGLLARCRDGCFLLRTLVQNNLSRASARMEQGGDQGARSPNFGLYFREWVVAEEGEVLARKLIAACLSELRPGPAEELTATLRAGCPSFFESSDQTYYAAASLLTTAEKATNVGDRDEAVIEAVKMLLQVPQACDLEALIPRLLALRAAGPAVDIIAATRRVASQREEADDKIAALLGALSCFTGAPDQRSMDSASSQTTKQYVKVLEQPRQNAVSSQEAQRMLQDVLTRIVASGNAALRDVAISTLVRTNPKGALTAGIRRLDIPPGSVEAVLVGHSGLWDVSGGLVQNAVNGNEPLDQDQLAHAEVLARYYVQAGQYASAAGVYELLASRPPAPKEEPEPTLEQRLMALEAAVLQARSCGEAALIERLEGKLRVAQVQAALLESTSGHQVERAGQLEKELGRRLMSLEELYNDLAVPHKEWATCLELLDISSLTAEPAYVAQLWDLLLESALSSGRESGSGSGASRAFDTVVVVGRRLHQKPESTFPVAHIAMRLEQVGASVWPSSVYRHGHGDGTENGGAWRAMLAACSGSYQSVLAAYQDLLTEPGTTFYATQDGTTAGPSRGQLLRSLAELVEAGIAEGGVGGKQVDSGLERRMYAACRTFEGEARRLGEGSVADSLSRMGSELKRRLARW